MNEQQGFPDINSPIAGPYKLEQIWYQLLITLWTRTGSGPGTKGVPTGTVADFAGPVIPDGWLLCDGAEVSRERYSDLFNTIGIVWGAGNGTTTFNIPDLRGRLNLGTSASHVLGTTGGFETVTLTVDQLPAHNHGIDDPGHNHAVTDPTHLHAVTDPQHLHAVTDPTHLHTITDPQHTHVQQIFANNVGGAAGTQGSDTADSFSVGTTNNAATGITIDKAATGVTVDKASTGVSVNKASTGVTVNTNTTGVTTLDTGNGDPVDILPPFAALKKMIKI